MEQKRPSIPMQVQAFRRRRWRPRWPWVLAAALVALLLIWLVSRTPGESSAPSRAPVSTAQVAGPPWQMGNPEGRFTLTLYADLECPFCREYFPQLKRWVGNNTDVALQWHHQPLAAHEPAASAEARLAECAAEAGGHAAFWQAVEWVYAHTRSDGQGLPDGLRYP
ncbi:DsbA family protein, partial [Pseudomonas oryzihabitans]